MQIRNQWKRPRDWKIVAGAGALATVGVASFALGPIGGGNGTAGAIELEDRATISDARVPAPLPANGIVSLADLADDLDSPFDDNGRNNGGGGGGDDSPNDSPPRRGGGGGGGDSPNDSPSPDSPDNSPPRGGGGAGDSPNESPSSDSPDNSPASPASPASPDSPDDSPASPASPDTPDSPDSPDGSGDSSQDS